MPQRPLRLAPARGLKERRLEALLGGRDPRLPELRRLLAAAVARGSLELAGIAADAGAAERLARALAEPPSEPSFGAKALLAWHAALSGHGHGHGHGFRRTPATRPDGAPAAAPEFVAERVEQLAAWLASDSGRELTSAQAGALVLARLTEIRPFDAANGRTSRLAAAHVMVATGGCLPLLVAADAPRLEAALAAAFRLETAALAELRDEAAERSLDLLLERAATLGVPG
jgi:hypothetical protein